MSHERAHAELLLRESKGFVIVLLSDFDVGGTAMRMDLAQEPECPRLMTALLPVADAGAAVAGDAMADAADPPEFLDVQVHQAPGPGVFVALHGGRGSSARSRARPSRCRYRATVARLRCSARAIWAPVQRWRRRCWITMTSSGAIAIPPSVLARADEVIQ